MDPESASPQGTFDGTCDFLIAVVVVARRYGITSEAAGRLLGRFAVALGVRAEFGVDPQRVVAVFSEMSSNRQRVHLIKVRPAGFDMSRLAHLSDILGRLESRSWAPAQAIARFHDLENAPPVYGRGLAALGFVLSAVAFAAMLQISWISLALAGVLSLVSFGLSLFARGAKSPEFAATLVISLLANLAAKLVPGVNPAAVTVSAVIWFVPGFSLTLGVRELVSGATVIGLDLLSGTLLTSLKLLVGNALGAAIADSLLATRSLELTSGVPSTWVWGFVPMLSLGLAIISQVRSKELGWMVPASLLVWTVQQGGNLLGPWEGAFLGALVLRLFAGFFAGRTGLPASIVLLPNVLLLVPGVAALRILHELPGQGLVAGLNAGTQVLLLCGAIVVGMALGEGISSAMEKRWRIKMA